MAIFPCIQNCPTHFWVIKYASRGSKYIFIYFSPLSFCPFPFSFSPLVFSFLKGPALSFPPSSQAWPIWASSAPRPILLSSEAVRRGPSGSLICIAGPGHLHLYTSATSSSHAGEGIDVDACRRGQGASPPIRAASRASLRSPRSVPLFNFAAATLLCSVRQAPLRR